MQRLKFALSGNQRDDEDPRTKSLLVLIKLFAEVKKPPTFLMLENVSGFQTSRTREQVVAALAARDYAFQEVMLSTSDIGIPNSRLRYFLLVRTPGLRWAWISMCAG